MDAFFASVEQLDNPDLRGKPVAVGGNAERGVIAAASYEARKFGVKSAMSSKIAAQKCNELIFVKPRFERYKEISLEIQTIFHRYTDLVEPLSIDEAYLDVSFNHMGINSATFIAQAIKNDIRNELNLIASAGVSYNKFLAKMASDQDKPDGLFVIEPKNAIGFLDRLKIGKFYGVGKVTATKMRELGIENGLDLRAFSEEVLVHHFGKSGSYFYQVARGIDDRQVKVDRQRKSIAVERTFNADITDANTFRNEANAMLEKLWKRYDAYENDGKTLNIKLKFNDFTTMTRAKSEIKAFQSFTELHKKANQLIEQVLPLEKPIRLIGFQISGFQLNEMETKSPEQLTLQF